MSAREQASAWLDPRRTNRGGEHKLLCLPYAGGASALFWTWQEHLPSCIDVAPILLPGRDRRRRDPSIESIQALAKKLVGGLEAELQSAFSIFGHSMGALLAFELCHALRARGLPQPEQLFVAGFRSPELPDRNPILHGLPEPEFVKALELLGATPPEILEFEGILALLLPTIRGDLKLVETYRWKERARLSLPITALCSRADPLVSIEEMQPWEQHTTADFALVQLEGGHFFLESARDEILAAVTRRTEKRAER